MASLFRVKGSSLWLWIFPVVLGLASGSLTASLATSGPAVGHTVSTEPQRLAKSTALAKETLVVADSGLSANALKIRLGRDATVRQIAAGLEVKGVAAGHLAAAVHAMTRGGARVTVHGRQIRPTPVTENQTARLNALNGAFVAYGLAGNFGQGEIAGPGHTVGKSVYPVPKCWKMTCIDCGAPPQGGTDCSDLEKAKDAAYDAYMKAAASQELWQMALQAYKDMAFYGGVAGMINDMVGAATTVLTAGGGTAAARAGANLLIQMARDGVLEALMTELGIPGLSDMTEQQVEQKLAAAEAARVAAAAALEAARKAWVDCMNSPGAMTAAQLQAHKAAVARYDGCRYRVYMGEEPECSLKEATCP